MARALKIAETQIKTLSEKITQDKPKVIFADAVTASHTSILVGELAKLLHQNGVEIGQNRLFDWLRQNGFLISRNGSDYNMPTQKSMELGLFGNQGTDNQRAERQYTSNQDDKSYRQGAAIFSQ